ncbi:MAG: hypothetical protein GXP19_00765 [Gammaproteobacteria bacterium]|nr:hypothetical protein [Gammaproteobacteria bacterium]
MKKLLLFSFFVLFSVCLSMQMAYSRTVEVEGSAVITDGAVNKARLQAIQDAIRQALLQTSASVSTASIVSSNVMIMDSTKIRATGRVSNVVIIDEWRNEDEIHVLIRAKVPENIQQATNTTKGYRRKLAVVQFHVVDRREIQDLPNIEIEYPRRLLRRIEENGGIIGIDATNYLLNSKAQSLDHDAGHPGKETIINLASTLGVQFIVSGIIRDMSVVNHLIGKSRLLSLELQVFDGLTGTLLSRNAYNKNVNGAGLNDSDSPFGTREFFNSNYGIAVDKLLSQQITSIQSVIFKLPVTVRVVRSEGKRVYFDAGAISLVHVGDMLMAYKVDSSPLVKMANSSEFGFPEKPVATVTVKKIQPLFSMGELETDKVTLKPGDLLRFGW